MNTTTKHILLATAITMLAACGNNETPPSGNNPSPDMNSNDMSADMDMGEKDTSPDTPCTPNKTTCEATDCGMIDNGCGTALDCGACACTDGVAEARSCGVCDLGKPVCDADANSKEIASCSYPTELLSNFTEDLCQSMVFVSADAAPNGTGAIDAPFNTYAKALEFLGTQAGIVVVARGTYNEPLIVKERIHVLGGYRFTNGLVQNDTQVPEFKPPAKTGEPVFGMIAKDIFEPTLVYRVRVRAPDADKEQTSYGAYIVDSKTLTISHSEIYAGRGGDGIDGENGMKGADGGNGEETCATLLDNDGGVNTVCPRANGGNGGGQGVFRRQNGNNSPPKPGGDAIDAKGGIAGVNERTSGTNAGMNGQNGPSHAIDATNGKAGVPTGSIVTDLWKSGENGLNGDSGLDGSGGGGGGGAGAPDLSNTNLTAGAAGGGGGAGGCGGKEGHGGTNGGASIGGLVIRSQLTLDSTFVAGGVGGTGGQGGSGGLGGFGGKGGSGTAVHLCHNYPAEKNWTSGNGGNGANGQRGGHGGGGAGGPSYGLYCLQSPVTKDNQTQIFVGTGGNGGLSVGQNGPMGLSANQNRCFE